MKKEKRCIFTFLAFILMASMIFNANAGSLEKDEQTLLDFEEAVWDPMQYEPFLESGNIGGSFLRAEGEEALCGEYSYKISMPDGKKPPKNGYVGVHFKTGAIKTDVYSGIAVRVKFKINPLILNPNYDNGEMGTSFMIFDQWGQGIMNGTEKTEFIHFINMNGKEVKPKTPDIWLKANYPLYRVGTEFDGWVFLDFSYASSRKEKDGMYLTNWKLDQSDPGCKVTRVGVGFTNADVGSYLLVDDFMLLKGDFTLDAAKELVGISTSTTTTSSNVVSTAPSTTPSGLTTDTSTPETTTSISEVSTTPTVATTVSTDAFDLTTPNISGEQTHISENENMGGSSEKSNSGLVAIIIIAAIVLLGGAGAAVYFFIIKKKKG